ncbi:hypothetical protein [Calycomorphotria hydatis]|uniref:Carboxypeptidase regulatory-like domain-containing protein n=1 Tax=Calycomorphotria hydatis TaxID=2528027 RepID=A0A517TA63_9PLAN|nr:hypothetical protein [Calycomorphotria hydatis]QDT65256.1 hypothetical protein V22_25030 [Calycomorphotria hydatis]
MVPLISRYWLVPAVIILLAGCFSGPAVPQRMIVQGKVTWNGQPLESGKLLLIPKTASAATSSGADIVDGQYKIDNKGGAMSGVYRVEITAERVIGKPLPGEVDPITEQYIPDRYNANSTLTIDVNSSAGPVLQDFELREME